MKSEQVSRIYIFLQFLVDLVRKWRWKYWIDRRTPPQRCTGLSLIWTNPKFTLPVECHKKIRRCILKHALLNNFVWKQFIWILMAKYAANTAWVLLIDKVSFSLGVPPLVKHIAIAPKRKDREWEMCIGFCHCLTNLSSLLDLLPPSGKQFPRIKEGVENHNACVPNLRGKHRGWVRSLHADLVSWRLNCITLTQWQNPHVL